MRAAGSRQQACLSHISGPPTHSNSATQGGVSEDRRKAAVLDEAEEEKRARGENYCDALLLSSGARPFFVPTSLVFKSGDNTKLTEHQLN